VVPFELVRPSTESQVDIVELLDIRSQQTIDRREGEERVRERVLSFAIKTHSHACIYTLAFVDFKSEECNIYREYWEITENKMVFVLVLLVTLLCTCIDRAHSLGDYGGTYWENRLETPIDLREPRSFPQSGLLVVRQKTFNALHKGSGKVYELQRIRNLALIGDVPKLTLNPLSRSGGECSELGGLHRKVVV